MHQPDFTIQSDCSKSIQASFDRIANELITGWHLKINDHLFSFVELEFFQYKDRILKYSPARESYECHWCLHLQGLGISFPVANQFYGGLLIQGIRSDNEIISGSRRVLEIIFRYMHAVTVINQEIGLVAKPFDNYIQINKCKIKDQNHEQYIPKKAGTLNNFPQKPVSHRIDAAKDEDFVIDVDKLLPNVFRYRGK